MPKGALSRLPLASKVSLGVVLLLLVATFVALNFPKLAAFLTGRYTWVEAGTLLELAARTVRAEQETPIFPGPILVVWRETGRMRWDVQPYLPSEIQPHSEQDLAAVALVERHEYAAGYYTPDGGAGYYTADFITVVSYPEGRILSTGSVSGPFPPMLKEGRRDYHGEPPDPHQVVDWIAEHYLLTIPGALQAHTAGVTRLAFSADGAYLISGDSRYDEPSNTTRCEIIIWDTESRQPVRQLEGCQVTVDADAGQLAALQRSLAVVWDIESGAELARFETGGAQLVAFDASASRLVTRANEWPTGGSYKLLVQQWDIASERETSRIELAGLEGSPEPEVAVSPDGSLLAVTSWRTQYYPTHQVLDLYTFETGDLLAEWTDEGGIHGASFHPEGRLLAYARTALDGVEQGFVLWDVARRQVERTLPGTGHNLRFSQDGSLLAAASGKDILVYSVATGEVTHEFSQESSVWSLAFSPGGSLLASGGEDKAIRLWELAP